MVALGLISRKISDIPLFVGDILYAVMVYFGCCLLFIDNNNSRKILFPLLFCYCIEIQQLYHSDWIIEIRNTTFGQYVLGQGFLWSDLVCYTVGVVMSFLIDAYLLKRSNLKSAI